MTLGSRVKMLGWRIERETVRHYMGRLFATCASLTLNLPVYDTQCGAKVFARHPAIVAAFAEPFSVSWIFDVELIARIASTLPLVEREEMIIEHPLRQWRDVAGSKVKLRHLVISFLDLIKIAIKYSANLYRT